MQKHPHERFRSLSAALTLGAAMGALANVQAVGAQTTLAPRAAQPGERLRPPPRRTKKVVDVERMAAAEAKRARRSAIWSRRVANGHQRQLATSRSAAA